LCVKEYKKYPHETEKNHLDIRRIEIHYPGALTVLFLYWNPEGYSLFIHKDYMILDYFCVELFTKSRTNFPTAEAIFSISAAGKLASVGAGTFGCIAGP
jgi:hypothetical protein